jgi:uncharacterized RDD family membrane protein YckC
VLRPDSGQRTTDVSRRRDPAPLARRLASLFYEAVLLSAVLWCAGLPFALIEGYYGAAHIRPVYQLYLITVAGAYFAWQWRHGGATLPMKTWRLELVSTDGSPLTATQAVVRYVTAVGGLAFFAIGFLWALFDPERAFLHDRIARTRIVNTRE